MMILHYKAWLAMVLCATFVAHAGNNAPDNQGKVSTTDKVLRALPIIPAIVGAGAVITGKATSLMSRELFFSAGLQAYKVALCANSLAFTVGLCATGFGIAHLLYHRNTSKDASQEKMKTTGYAIAAALIGAAGLYVLSATNADFIGFLKGAPGLVKDMMLCKEIF